MKIQSARKKISYCFFHFFFSLLLIFLILGESGCKEKNKPKEPDREKKIYPVSIFQVSLENIPENLELKGNFAPSDKLEIKAEVEAKVVSVAVSEGQSVNQNELLATLDPERLKLSLDLLKSEVEETEARMEAGLPLLASSSLAHPAEQLTKPSRPSSPDEVGEEKPNSETAPSDPIARAEEAALNKLKAEIAFFEKKLEAINVNAAIGGFLTKKEITQGSLIKPGDLLFQIVKIDPIFLVLFFPKEAVLSLQKGSRIEAYAEDFPNQTFVGEIASIAPELDSQGRGYEVKIAVPNSLFKIRGGMLGRTILPNFQFRKGLVVPEAAILHQDWKKYIYLVVGENLAERREVELGQKIGNRVEITKGVLQRDKIVSKGHFTFDEPKEFIRNEEELPLR